MKTRRQILSTAACAVAGSAVSGEPQAPSLNDVIAFLKEKWSDEKSRFLPFSAPNELASHFWALDNNDWEVIQDHLDGVGRLYILGEQRHFTMMFCSKKHIGPIFVCQLPKNGVEPDPKDFNHRCFWARTTQQLA